MFAVRARGRGFDSPHLQSKRLILKGISRFCLPISTICCIIDSNWRSRRVPSVRRATPYTSAREPRGSRYGTSRPTTSTASACPEAAQAKPPRPKLDANGQRNAIGMNGHVTRKSPSASMPEAASRGVPRTSPPWGAGTLIAALPTSATTSFPPSAASDSTRSLPHN